MAEANREMNYSEAADADYRLFPECDARIGLDWDTSGLQLGQTGVEHIPWIPFDDHLQLIADWEAQTLTEYAILNSTGPLLADLAAPGLDAFTIIQSLDQQLSNGPSSSGAEKIIPSLGSTSSPFMNDSRVPLTLSMSRNSQHDLSHTKRVKTLDELPNELKFLISRRMERQPWDMIHMDYNLIFGDATKKALEMRFSRLRSNNPNVRRLFQNEKSFMPIKFYSDHGNLETASVDSGTLRDSNTYVLCSSMEKLWLSKVLQALVIVSLTLTRHLTGQFGILE
ncbi:hypothetical protein QL093DRAFT_2565780 [Fusarium oxysporum]|nr:hypothetical protein QL093DRAFT_2565780 [Fusarium oxysporum]